MYIIFSLFVQYLGVKGLHLLIPFHLIQWQVSGPQHTIQSPIYLTTNKHTTMKQNNNVFITSILHTQTHSHIFCLAYFFLIFAMSSLQVQLKLCISALLGDLLSSDPPPIFLDLTAPSQCSFLLEQFTKLQLCGN